MKAKKQWSQRFMLVDKNIFVGWWFKMESIVSALILEKDDKSRAQTKTTLRGKKLNYWGCFTVNFFCTVGTTYNKRNFNNVPFFINMIYQLMSWSDTNHKDLIPFK